MNKIHFANLSFKGLDKRTLLIEELFLKFIVTVNAEFIIRANSDNSFKKLINSNYATFDGQVPYIIARRQNPNIHFQKLSGSDLIYDFAEMAKEKKKKMFLLGGYEESNKGAIKKIKSIYDIQIDGFSPVYQEYPFTELHNILIIEKIKVFKPDILFVGFGAIKQEFWINEHKEILEKIGVKWVIGSGGTFEFVAGTIKRAPIWIQKIGLEGAYRTIKEPNLMRFKRLLFSFKIFKYI